MPLGYIRDKADMKLLLLHILNEYAGSKERIKKEILYEAVLSDGCSDYFNFITSLEELVSDGFIGREATEDGSEYFWITLPGSVNYSAVDTALPLSVRRYAGDAVKKALSRVRRDDNIETASEHFGDTTGYVTTLSMSDGRDELIVLRLIAANASQSKQMEKAFKANAEGIYMKIMSMLLGDEKE